MKEVAEKQQSTEPLSDERINELWSEHASPEHGFKTPPWIRFARAIERAALSHRSTPIPQSSVSSEPSASGEKPGAVIGGLTLREVWEAFKRGFTKKGAEDFDAAAAFARMDRCIEHFAATQAPGSASTGTHTVGLRTPDVAAPMLIGWADREVIGWLVGGSMDHICVYPRQGDTEQIGIYAYPPSPAASGLDAEARSDKPKEGGGAPIEPLPPLPEPAGDGMRLRWRRTAAAGSLQNEGHVIVVMPAFTAEQMQEYARAALARTGEGE